MFTTCPKRSSSSIGGREGSGGSGVFGAQRLWFMRHSLAEERPELLAKVEEELLRRQALKSLSRQSKLQSNDTDDNTVTEYLPCTDDFATAYLNRLDVQQAIHVNGGSSLGNASLVEWSECSRAIRYNMTDGRTPMQPLYSYLLNATNGFGLKVLVYSGDDDMVCSTSGSQEWIYGLGFDTVPDRGWHSWHYDDDVFGRQAGGFVASFEEREMSGHFAFVTAHACGHEVPTYKPQLALELFKNYLDGRVFS